MGVEQERVELCFQWFLEHEQLVDLGLLLVETFVEVDYVVKFRVQVVQLVQILLQVRMLRIEYGLEFGLDFISSFVQQLLVEVECVVDFSLGLVELLRQILYGLLDEVTIGTQLARMQLRCVDNQLEPLELILLLTVDAAVVVLNIVTVHVLMGQDTVLT
jgi:hypothetical protein